MNNAKNEMIDQHMIIVPCQMEPLEKIFHLYNLAPFVVFGPLVFCLFIIYLKFFWKKSSILFSKIQKFN
jgi:hypothetical protein